MDMGREGSAAERKSTCRRARTDDAGGTPPGGSSPGDQHQPRRRRRGPVWVCHPACRCSSTRSRLNPAARRVHDGDRVGPVIGHDGHPVPQTSTTSTSWATSHTCWRDTHRTTGRRSTPLSSHVKRDWSEAVASLDDWHPAVAAILGASSWSCRPPLLRSSRPRSRTSQT